MFKIEQLLSQKEFFFHVAISFVARVFAALAALIVSVVIARNLGLEESGYYFLALSLVMFLAAVARLGLDNTVVRFAGSAMPAGQWGVVRELLNKSLLMTFLISVIIAFGLFVSSNYLAVQIFGKPSLAPVLKGISPSIVGLSLFTIVSMGLQGLRRVIASVVTLNILVNLSLVIILYLCGMSSAENLAWGYSIATFITLLCGYYFYRRVLLDGGGGISWRQLFQSCMPLLLVVVMQQIAQWSGQFISGVWASSGDIAQLAVAQRTAMLASFVLIAVNLVVAPRFSEMYQQGRFGDLEKLALTSTKLVVILALPLIAVMQIIPEFFMSFFGEGFDEGAYLLRILVVGQFVNVATGGVSYLLVMSGNEKDLRSAVLISGSLAIILGFTLIPLYGVVGSATATAIAVAAQHLLAVWWVRKRLGFNTLAIWR